MTDLNASSGPRVVISGSGRGIGRALGEHWLDAGAQVLFSDVNEDALAAVRSEITDPRAAFCACNVGQGDELEALWDHAIQSFGGVDYWINNAAIGAPQVLLGDTPPDIVERLLSVNVIGVQLGTRVALRGLLAQGSGAVYNMAGFGSDGFTRPRMALYGASKCAVAYFSRAVAKELRDGPVRVGLINPGMAISEMVIDEAKTMSPEAWRSGRRVFNLFGETVEDTAAALVEQLAAGGPQGHRIHLLPKRKMLWRLLMAPLARRDIVSQYGI